MLNGSVIFLYKGKKLDSNTVFPKVGDTDGGGDWRGQGVLHWDHKSGC